MYEREVRELGLVLHSQALAICATTVRFSNISSR
jgi:hypothetical protein